MRIALVTLLSALLLASCSNPPREKPLIAASFYPVYFLAKEIAGSQADVVNIVPAGTEPHDFELTPSARRTIEEAEIVFANGLGMDRWSEGLPKGKVMTLAAEIDQSKINAGDPHIWLDTRLYREMGQAVFAKLKTTSLNAELLESNWSAFSSKLAKLEEDCQRIASAFQNKVIAVSHNAYGYLCAEWNITQLSIHGLSPEDEPSAQDLSELLDAVNEHHIDTIFFEELAPKDLSDYIASQTGAKTECLSPIEGLTSEEEKKGEDYFSLYRSNLQKIAEARND